MCFSLRGCIGPFTLDPDIIFWLAAEQTLYRQGPHSAYGAAEELYDDAGQGGTATDAMLDDQIR